MVIAENKFESIVEDQTYQFTSQVLIPSVLCGYWIDICFPEVNRAEEFAIRVLQETDEEGVYSLVIVDEEPIIDYYITDELFESGLERVGRKLFDIVTNVDCILVNSFAYPGCEYECYDMNHNGLGLIAHPEYGVAIVDENGIVKINISYDIFSQMYPHLLPVFRGMDNAFEIKRAIETNLKKEFA